MKQKGIGLLASHTAVIADQLLHRGDRAIRIKRTVDDQITGVGEIGHSSHLQRAQIRVAVGGQGVLTRHFAAVQVAGTVLAKGYRCAVVAIGHHKSHPLVGHQCIDQIWIGAVQLLKRDFAWVKIEIYLG